MSNIFIIITLAIVLEIAEIVFYMFILKKYKEKSITATQIVVSFLIIFITLSLLSGLYIVTTNQGYVYRGFSGVAKIITNPGIKYAFPYITTIEKYDLRGTYLTYPSDSNPVNLPTGNNQVLLVAGTMYYRINNLTDYAVNNFNTEPQIYNYLTALIKNEVKSKSKEDLIKNRNEVEKNIIMEMNNFGKTRGFSVNNFKFTNLAETREVIDANNYKSSTGIKSLADKDSNELLQSSLNKYTPSQLEYLKTKILSENPNIKWVLQNGGNAIVNTN